MIGIDDIASNLYKRKDNKAFDKLDHSSVIDREHTSCRLSLRGVIKVVLPEIIIV